MSVAFWKVAITLAFFLSGSVHSSPVKQEVERKWVPYQVTGYTIGGTPAFCLILETFETACGKSQHPERCRFIWESIPKAPPPLSQDEIQYLEDYGDGPQQTRLTKKVYCAITGGGMESPSSCDARWKVFERKQRSKEA